MEIQVTYALELRGITTIYPADHFIANRDVSLSIRAGEVLCLVGENGAGKTSLMKVLNGFIRPARGEILVKGEPVIFSSPLGAARLGIGMVHQHFMLFPDFTVAENAAMGLEPVKAGFVYDTKRAEEAVEALIQEHGFSISARDRVSDLSVGQMQQVEIVKLLYRNAEILIFDEPTAALTEQEAAALFSRLRLLARAGKSIILITHKLSEVKQVSDRVAVMRKGELAAVRETACVSEHELSRLMLGREAPARDAPRKRRKRGRGTGVLSFDKVSVKRRKQARPLLNELTFTARAGEILAFAGAGNSGLEELEAVLGGLLPISSGRITHKGGDISRLNAAGLRKQHLAYVPADRLHVGTEARALISENIMIVRRRELARRCGLLNRAAVSRFCHALFERFAIRGNEFLRIGSLSGGNIQKLILAREIDLLERGGDYIVFSKPAWGLDVAASSAVYERIIQLREKGAAILLLSSNIDEIISLADRVLVLYRGSIAAELDAHGPEPRLRERIGAYMLGLRRGAAAQSTGGAAEAREAAARPSGPTGGGRPAPLPREAQGGASQARAARLPPPPRQTRRAAPQPPRRRTRGPWKRIGGMALMVTAALAALVMLGFLFSKTPLRTLRYFFFGPVQSIYYFGNMLNSAVPLIFGGLGASIAMRSNNLNLGGEGQVYIGGFISAVAALALAPLGALGAAAGLLAGALGAGLIAGASGFLKAAWGASELTSTFLLSNILLLIVDYLITGPFLDSETSLQSTAKIAPWFRLPKILPPSSLSAALFCAVAVLILVYFFLYHTLMGYEMRISGLNETFARYGGIDTAKSIVSAMFLSGALYGLAGGMAVYGTYYAAVKGFSAGMGWNGLAVALIARSRPQAVIPAAIFFAWIESGASLAMQFSDVTIELASVAQSVVFFMASSAVIRAIFTPMKRQG
jgi:ABC-type uncharacterized transport system ATPase subunit/ABC-type uncharacterized transport system permease subunit